MPTAILNSLKIFRDKIYHCFHYRKDATMELIDALSSNTTANSVVELSLNPLHRRNYCSITRVLDKFNQLKDEGKQQRERLIPLLTECCPALKKRPYHIFGVDCTSSPRVFSPTLADRSCVYAPNTISDNQPITIGHQYSIAAYLPEKLEAQSPPWVIPLSCERVSTHQKGIMVGMSQITTCIQSQETFKNALCISVGDSAYSHPSCLAHANKNPHQIHISRARNNRVFYYPSTQIKACSKRGRLKFYGDKHHLANSQTWKTPDECFAFDITSKKGKPQQIQIECWNKMIMRGNRKAKVSDCYFRLLRVRIYKSSEELLFKRPMWLIVSGKRRDELSLLEIFNVYRQRFDLEHFFRFGKNKLLMNKIQTSEVDHEEAWWQIVMIAYVQLYLAREIANNTLNPWEKYLPILRSSTQAKSPTQVQKDFGRIIRGIGTPAQPPKPRNKSHGRRSGEKQPKRPRYQIVFKSKNVEKLA
jgi:hypothetical protein